MMRRDLLTHAADQLDQYADLIKQALASESGDAWECPGAKADFDDIKRTAMCLRALSDISSLSTHHGDARHEH